MPDELGQEEQTSPNQTAVAETNGSEAATNPVDTTEPDLRVPLKEERQKRQQLENQLNDPMFIYEQAKRLGLAEEDAQTVTEIAAEGKRAGVNQPDISQQIPAIVQRQLEVAKAKEKYPELETDNVLGAMVTALIQGGLSPMKAADEVFSRMQTVKADKDKSQQAEQDKIDTKKENAHTETSGVHNPASIDDAELARRSRSFDSREQSTAMIELLKRRNKATGLFS